MRKCYTTGIWLTPHVDAHVDAVPFVLFFLIEYLHCRCNSTEPWHRSFGPIW